MTIEIRTAPNYDLEGSWATFASGEYETDTDGTRTWKMADDLRRYQAVIEATKPEVIVETGTKFGGSARWFKSLGLDVISVDIDATYSGQARHEHPDIHWIIGDTTDPSVLSCVVDLIAGRRTMVSLDSEHAFPHVVAEIGLYGPLVTPGCYLVVEDGIFDLIGQDRAHLGGARIPAEGGPLRAIIQTVARDSANWKRDIEIEAMTPRSYHPGGFWVKKEPKVVAPRKVAARKAPRITAAAETAAILADPDTMADIREAEADIAAGRLIDASELADVMAARRPAA
jgi:cephalosporin hydroxylase